MRSGLEDLGHTYSCVPINPKFGANSTGAESANELIIEVVGATSTGTELATLDFWGPRPTFLALLLTGVNMYKFGAVLVDADPYVRFEIVSGRGRIQAWFRKRPNLSK
jgi:hypothetical protein